MSWSYRWYFLVTFGAVLGLLVPSPAQASIIYLNIPSIAGEDPVPGHPGTMAVQSLTITPDAFSVVKRVDKASPAIFNAVVTGTPLGTASVFLYNSTPSGPADATLSFPNVLASSYQLLGGQWASRERWFPFNNTCFHLLGGARDHGRKFRARPSERDADSNFLVSR
jgi:hypothetical protein